MKKTILLFVSVLTLALVSTSCSKDDDAGEPSIVGKWEISKQGIVSGGQELVVNHQHQCAASKDNVEFKANLTAVYTTYYSDACLVDTDNATYTKSGATLTITDEDGAYSDIVKELSAATLKIYDTYEDEDTGVTVTDVTVYTRVN